VNLSACSALARGPEAGVWYRAIQPQHWQTALSTVQSKVIPSRFNAGPTASPQFEILYLSENHTVALFEVEALFGSPWQPTGLLISNPKQAWIIINVTVRLQNVADLTQVSQQNLLGTMAQELTGDWRGYQQRNSTMSVSQPVGIAPLTRVGFLSTLRLSLVCRPAGYASPSCPRRRASRLFA
jgi:RES domain-containing protein